jgi:hypothetical protein
MGWDGRDANSIRSTVCSPLRSELASKLYAIRLWWLEWPDSIWNLSYRAWILFQVPETSE